MCISVMQRPGVMLNFLSNKAPLIKKCIILYVLDALIAYFNPNCFQDISGDELVKALQIKEKIPRRKALSALEEKVIMILSEQGYVSKDEASGAIESLVDIVEEEDEDEVIEDGEVDEGDVHIKPVSRKPHRQVMVIILFSLNMCYRFPPYITLLEWTWSSICCFLWPCVQLTIHLMHN